MKSVIPLDQFSFHHRVAATPGHAIVAFTTAGCGACRRWREVLVKYAQHHRDVTIYEVDAERDAALTREFEVLHLPALFLFVNGEFHAPLQSEASPERLKDAIVSALTDPAHESP